MEKPGKLQRTSSRASPETAEYTLDDLQSDAGHLYHLLDIIVDDGGDQQRVMAVAWVARDLAQLINQKLEEGIKLRRDVARAA